MNTNQNNDPLKRSVWGLAQPTKGKPYPLPFVLAVMLMWAMVGLTLLAFVEPGGSMMSKMGRGLGWILSSLMVPMTLMGAADLINRSKQPRDLLKGLD
jgi:hypothetical protein